MLVIGGGNTAMDAARTARRLGGHVTIVYRRTRAEMPARVEELEHALEEGIELVVLRSPIEFLGDDATGFVTATTLEVMGLGEPDALGRRRPVATGRTETMHGGPGDHGARQHRQPDHQGLRTELPRLSFGTIVLDHGGSQETSLSGVYTGGDAARGGSTAISAAGDGQSAAREIVGHVDVPTDQVEPTMVRTAMAYTESASPS